MTELYLHPEYRRNRDTLKMLHDLYKGDHDILKKSDYLWFHPLERRKSANQEENARIIQMRADREQRSRYLNIPEIVVSILLSTMFRKKYELDAAAKTLLEPYEDDIDGMGTSLHTFIRDEILENILVYGSAYVVVDAFPFRAMNAGEEQALGLRPFFESINPIQVKDWDIELADTARLGKYNFLRHEQEVMFPRERPTDKPERAIISVSLERIDGVYAVTRHMMRLNEIESSNELLSYIDQKNWEQLGDTIVTDRDEIPLATIIDTSWIKDVCQETLRHFNLRSMKDSVEFAQGFQKLFVTGVDFSNPQAVAALSEFTVSGLPENAQVISIEPVSTADLRASIAESLDNAFKVGLNTLRQLPSDSRAAQSSETQQEDKDSTVQLMESVIEDVEVLVNESIENFASFLGKENFEGKISLNQELTEKSVNTLVTLWQAFGDLYSGNEVVTKAMQRKILSKLDFNSEDAEAALEAIERIGGRRQQAAENPLRQNLLATIRNGRREPTPQNTSA